MFPPTHLTGFGFGLPFCGLEHRWPPAPYVTSHMIATTHRILICMTAWFLCAVADTIDKHKAASEVDGNDLEIM